MGENLSYFLWNIGDLLVVYYEVLCSVVCFMRKFEYRFEKNVIFFLFRMSSVEKEKEIKLLFEIVFIFMK